MQKKIIYPILILNFLLTISMFFYGFKEKNIYKTVETEKMIVRKAGSNESIQIAFDSDEPHIDVINERGIKTFSFVGGEKNAIILANEEGKERTVISQNGIYLKNDLDKVIGSFTSLSDGGGGFGLADRDGMASSILRGGNNPLLSFFANKAEPVASIAVNNNTPHIVISGDSGNEGILIHGGQKSGMMVLDEIGQLKVFICKDGIYQGKRETQHTEKPKRKDLFTSREDKKILFPSIVEEKIR